MTATLVRDKEFTVTFERAIVKADGVVVVCAVESHIEFVEAKALAVFRVSLRFIKFADHSVVHTLSPFNF
jgi:hypothetical protein